MQIEHFILAKDSSIDLNTNSLSVFGVLDDMQIQAPPGITFNLSFHAILVVKRERETEQGPIQSNFIMSAYAPNGEKLGHEVTMPVQMQPFHRRTRLRVITEIPVNQSGVYTMRMVNTDNKNLAAEVSLSIQIMPVAVPSSPSSLQ